MSSRRSGNWAPSARSLGYNEILTYSFGSPTMFDQIRLPSDSPLRKTVTILNPLGEDTSIMRTTALPSMLETLGRNNAYHNKSVKLYEIAKIYLPKDGEDLPEEPKVLMLGSYGTGGDFFTLKGEIEAILHQIGTRAPAYEAHHGQPQLSSMPLCRRSDRRRHCRLLWTDPPAGCR